MRVKAAGKNATMVLLNAGASSVRILDALNIRRHVLGDEAPVSTSVARAPRLRAASGGPRIKASAGGGRVKASSGRARTKHVTVSRHRRHR
jgi:D-alanyl-D-alanine carboxypeptidase/D-alanyl-D-alanine endopeptidase (penicillin-binding protein 7)